MRTLRPLVAIAAMTVLGACSNPEADWRRAEAEDTEAAFQAFVERYPEGEWAARARSRLDGIRDGRDWENARATDAIEAYNSYLLAHPAGDHMGEARQRITELETDSAWAAAQAVGTREALEDFLLRYADTPQGEQARAQLAALAAPPPPSAAKPAAKPVAKPAAGPAARQPAARPIARAPSVARSDFQVQLGAFSTPEKAQSEKARLEQRLGEDLGALAVQPPTGADRLYRVRSAPLTETAARAACDRLRGAGQDCVVTRR